MKQVQYIGGDKVAVTTERQPATVFVNGTASLRIATGNFVNQKDIVILNVAVYSDGFGWSVDVIKTPDENHDLMCSAWVEGDPVMGERVPTKARLVAVHTVDKES
jgi:hypothetical protein